MTSILLIEDESSIREAEKLYLEQAGHTVLEAGSGTEAVQLWRNHGADLVVLDLNLPELDGIEVCKIIRQTNQEVPIIMVTARVEEIDEVAGLNVGADDYLKKPFSPKILVARVKALLRRAQPEETLMFSCMEINSERQAVRIGESWYPLTTIPFKILHLLAGQPDKVFSRDEILDRVYGEDATSVYDRVIDAHIKSIRQTLGDASVHVQTVIGSGYRFHV